MGECLSSCIINIGVKYTYSQVFGNGTKKQRQKVAGHETTAPEFPKSLTCARPLYVAVNHACMLGQQHRWQSTVTGSAPAET